MRQRRVTAAALVLAFLAAGPAPAAGPAASEVPAADVTVAVHDFGEFRIRLDPEAAPNAVAAFLSLAARGAYDSLAVHRVVPGLLIQSGNPATREGVPEGSPDAPAWRLPAPDPPDSAAAAASPAAAPPARTHRRGTVALAWRGTDPGSAGTEWYVALSDVPAADRYGTPIGEVVEGMEVVERIAQVPTFRDRRPTKRVLVTAVTVAPPAAPTASEDSAAAAAASP